MESKNICQLQKIYVLKDFLSMRIGFELQNLLLKKSKELSLINLAFCTNVTVINFYRKNGFEKLEITIFKLEENFFVAMKKEL